MWQRVHRDLYFNLLLLQGLMEEAKDSFASGELDETEFNLRKVTLEQNLYNGFPVCGNDALRLTLLSQNILGLLS